MQIYEPYANEGIPRLIAHKMEAFAGTSPIQRCPGSCSISTGVSSLLFSRASQISGLLCFLPSSSSVLFSGYSAMSDGQCQTHLQELLPLSIPGNHRKPQGTLHLAYFHLKSLDPHSSCSLCPPWSSEPSPGQSDTCQRQTHTRTTGSFRKDQGCLSSSCLQETQFINARPILSLSLFGQLSL